MKFAGTMVSLFVAAAAFFPAVAPAATAADLQSQMITLLQQVVDIQQQIIMMLQAQVNQLQAQANFFRETMPREAVNVTIDQTVTNHAASTPHTTLFVADTRSLPNVSSFPPYIAHGRPPTQEDIDFINECKERMAKMRCPPGTHPELCSPVCFANEPR